MTLIITNFLHNEFLFNNEDILCDMHYCKTNLLH